MIVKLVRPAPYDVCRCGEWACWHGYDGTGACQKGDCACQGFRFDRRELRRRNAQRRAARARVSAAPRVARPKK